jgi:hypothetical protein
VGALALVEVVVVVALLVVVALGKRSFSSSFWSAHRAIMSRGSTAVVRRLRPKSWYVLIGDVCDGGSYLEETLSVGPQGLVHLLLDLEQIMASTCRIMDP